LEDRPTGYKSTVTIPGLFPRLKPPRRGPGETITDFIQTDAAINKGNSGGAAFEICKVNWLAINTWISSQSGGSIGLGFAVPSNQTRKSYQ